MKSLLIYLFIVTVTTAWSQSELTLYGTIKDSINGDPLIGAAVYIKQTSTGLTADLNGSYLLKLAPGSYPIVVSYMGYEPQSFIIDLTTDKLVDIRLKPSVTELEEVVVTGAKEGANVLDNQMKVDIDMATIQRMPAFFGEVDILKSIQALPGVQSAGEGTTGFFVRGGAADQNLIQLDGATIYNPSHLMGFFSVFNSDAIAKAELYKSGIPAPYGGRLSSLLDIHSREGNDEKLSLYGGVGTIASRLTVEGPIKKDQSSFIVSARRTYADIFLKASSKEELRNSQLYFYDINGRSDIRLGRKDVLTLSTYYGDDVFKYKKTMDWTSGNRTGNVRWAHQVSEKLFADFSLLSTDFKYSLGSTSQSSFKWTSSIDDITMRGDFSYYYDNASIQFGLTSTMHRFSPGKVTTDTIQRVAMDKKRVLESAAYVGADLDLSEKMSLQVGLRLPVFQNIGGIEYSNFDEDGNPADTIAYVNNKVSHTYKAIEPRVSARFLIDETSSFKISYDRMFQYIQLASNTTSSFPLDIYFPADRNIRPQIADQFAAGYFKNFRKNMFEFSAEAFYKNLQNQVDFRDNANLFLNNHIEREVVAGKGRAYGMELMLKKREGKLTGWVGYSYSRSKREIPAINGGKIYRTRQDRPHSVNVVLSYQVRPRLQLGAQWMFASGTPVTVPVAGYTYDGVMVPVYGERNGYRLPSSHRLDLSLTLDCKQKEGKSGRGSWNFSVFNAYGNKNPFTLQTRPNEADPSKTEAVQLSIIGTVIPSITYNFKF